jgi:hypothetical protein
VHEAGYSDDAEENGADEESEEEEEIECVAAVDAYN